MSFNVRIYGYRGVTELKRVMPKQFAADSVQQLEQPYEFAQLLEVGGVAVRSTPDFKPATTILRVEVPDQQTVRYEICDQGRQVDAGLISPALNGRDNFKFAPGWTISLIDATGLD